MGTSAGGVDGETSAGLMSACCLGRYMILRCSGMRRHVVVGALEEDNLVVKDGSCCERRMP